MNKKKQVKKSMDFAKYRAKFSADNMETKTLQQKKIVNAFLAQIKLKKRSPVRLFAASLGVPANYIWNNAKIYWRGLAERWEALEIDDSFELVEALK